MALDLSALVGRSVQAVDKREYSWFFIFGENISIVTESLWRAGTADGIKITSEDHGQKFGLPAPVDAAEVVRTVISNDPVISATHEVRTGDLYLRFNGERYLPFLQTSAGYEAWRLYFPNAEFICMGGGGYASMPTGPGHGC